MTLRYFGVHSNPLLTTCSSIPTHPVFSFGGAHRMAHEASHEELGGGTQTPNYNNGKKIVLMKLYSSALTTIKLFPTNLETIMIN